MKTIVVKLPDDATSVDLHIYVGMKLITKDTLPILHGRREFLEKALEVGEFEAEERLPKKGETYLGALAGAKLNIHRANCDHAASVLPVLTNLDEPEEDEQKPIYTLNKEEVAEFTSFMSKCIKRRGGLIT